MNKQKSDCCNANVWVQTGEEGTACYICSFCKEACDIVGVNSYWYKGNTVIKEVSLKREFLFMILKSILFIGIGYVIGRFL